MKEMIAIRCPKLNGFEALITKFDEHSNDIRCINFEPKKDDEQFFVCKLDQKNCIFE